MSEDDVPDIERSSGGDMSSAIVDDDRETELESGAVPHGYGEDSEFFDTENEDED